MQILNKENLDAAIKKCQDDGPYRVIIVTERYESHSSIIDYLSRLELETVCRRHEAYVKFQNGSVIRMLSVADSTLGRKANLVLCVEKYFNDKTADKLRVIEISSDMMNFRRWK